MAQVTLHLRAETKPLEHRSALSPTVVKKLSENGFRVHVERSPQNPKRIFDDSDYEPYATLVDEFSWPQAPEDHLIIGLKELPEEDFPLKHTHIQFAHCYKGQAGWDQVLGRFAAGGGTLYDMEFLEDKNRRRVAAFGYHAGYAGAALALENWAWQLQHAETPLPGKKPYNTQHDLVHEVKTDVAAGVAKNDGKAPQILIIGAVGRCGRGAIDLCLAAGIPESNLLRWDLAETSAKAGPYSEIRQSDIFINCIYLDKPIPKFVTEDFLKEDPSSRKLSVVCDVSCDTTNPHNPIPFCNKPTYFDKPTITVEGFSNPPLSYITIDHLPSLLPREASEAFSNALLPSLLELPNADKAPVWQEARKLFQKKLATLPTSKNHNKNS
ncbi:MAG: hypothetical protein LQ337_002552 [Flavoplaca oasis]|nr:MAG: hypothetical protein LQ337_002552 [Flavoplaca oasis]